MTRFIDLLRKYEHLPPGEQQSRVEREFPEVSAEGPLHWLRPGEARDPSGIRLVIGVATYSQDDMRLLDAVAQAVANRNGMPIHVDVFSTLSCKTPGDFDAYVPGLGNVFQTPVAGLWIDGVPREKAWGAAARKLIAGVCRLDSLAEGAASHA